MTAQPQMLVLTVSAEGTPHRTSVPLWGRVALRMRAKPSADGRTPRSLSAALANEALFLCHEKVLEGLKGEWSQFTEVRWVNPPSLSWKLHYCAGCGVPTRVMAEVKVQVDTRRPSEYAHVLTFSESGRYHHMTIRFEVRWMKQHEMVAEGLCNASASELDPPPRAA